MRGVHYFAGLAVLGSALAGWAALALAQSGGVMLPPANQPMGAVPSAGAPVQVGQLPMSGPSAPGQVGQLPQAGPADPNSVGQIPVAVPTAPGVVPASGSPGLPGAPAMPVDPAMPMTPAVSEPVPSPQGIPGPGANYAPAAASPGGGEEQDLGPGQEEKNPTGRQEPAVSIEWIGPPVAKLGRPADYSVVVRNCCNIAVQQVMVRVRVPSGMAVNATEPKAVAEGNVLMWELGTMLPKQEKNLQMRLIAEGKGVSGCQAWVTFTGSSAMRIKVCEPKLLLKASAPEKVMVGDAATFVLTVSNPGDGPAEQVKIHADLSDGLEHARGKKVDFEIGNLGAGESRSVQLICATKMGGLQTCDATAEAEGDLRAQDKASVEVIMPRLALEVSGPKLRFLDRKALYSFKVTNPGDASATNVTVQDVIPPGFKFTNASDGGRHDFSSRTVSWFLGELAPAQSKEVRLEVLAVNPGEHLHKATAQAARGLKAEGEIMTRVEGLSAILLEVVDTEDPIEVGADTSYEIRVTNTGSKTETDIKLVCLIPEQMQFKAAQGPVRYHEQGKEVVFEPLPKLAPRADAIFRVNVKSVAEGSVRFKCMITSTNLQEPVAEQEATRIYTDGQ